MTQKQFNYSLIAQMEMCDVILRSKGEEYAPDALEDTQRDRLGHFKRAASMMNITPKAALMGMLSKHLISISDMCMDKADYPIEKWDEKITDTINYLFILKAIVEEESYEKNRSKDS